MTLDNRSPRIRSSDNVNTVRPISNPTWLAKLVSWVPSFHPEGHPFEQFEITLFIPAITFRKPRLYWYTTLSLLSVFWISRPTCPPSWRCQSEIRTSWLLPVFPFTLRGFRNRLLFVDCHTPSIHMSWRVGHVFYSPVHTLPIFASLAILNKLVWHKPLHITLFLSTLNFLSLSKRTVVVLLLFLLYLPLFVYYSVS